LIDVVTNLLGEIVEISALDYQRGSGSATYLPKARGIVRALYVANDELKILIEHVEATFHYGDRQEGGIAGYRVGENLVRAVQFCTRCFSWDRKALLSAIGPEPITYVHTDGKGCKAVGSGG
jgi:hypothetical protein